LTSFFRRNLIVLFVEKVGEWDDNETQYSVQAVQCVVDDLELEEYVVDLIW